MTDVLERYRAMIETPSALAVDPSALLRDMAAEIERLRGPRAGMNERELAFDKWWKLSTHNGTFPERC